MQKFFTQNLLCFVLIILGFFTNAQTINTLTVNSPDGIKGDYPILRAAFGSTSNSPITGNAAFGMNGNNTNLCTPATNNLTGLITFIDRGGCEFGCKSENAQTAGAIAVIICNNNSDPIFTMTGGSCGARVNVPVFMCSQQDCQKIRTDIIAGGVNVTLQNTCKNTAVYAPNTIWGSEERQGDFLGGLNDWTIDKDSTWAWTPDGSSEVEGWPKASYGGTTIVAFSGCNGAVVFNSDALDSKGTSTQGVGPCPAVCTGALISPRIDLTGKNIEGLIIEFSQATRQYQSTYYVMTSKDGGVTWPDTFVVNRSLPLNSAVIQDRQRIAIPGYENVTDFRFKFEYAGNYYYWIIDDVVVLNEAKADIQVNDNFYAGAPTLMTPVTQLAPMPILTDVSNIGNKDANNTKLDYIVTHREDNNKEVYRDTKNYGNIATNTSVENQVFANTFTPPATVGTYDARYLISADGDTTKVGNNTRNVFFYVTDNTFGTVNPEALTTPANYMGYALSPWRDGSTAIYYTMANPFYIVNNKVGGVNQTVSNLTFGFANPVADILESGYVQGGVYEWDDADGDNQCQPTERVKVGGGSLLLDSDALANPRSVVMPIWALNSDGTIKEGSQMKLKANTNYIATVVTEPLDPSIQYQLLGYSGRSVSSFDRTVNYAAARLALDSVPSLANRTAGSLFQMTGTDSDAEDRILEVIANGTLETAAFLEITVENETSTYDINDKIEVSTFPNPASREIYVDISLANASEVKLELMTIDGKLAATKSFADIQDARLKLDLQEVATGSYSLLIHTNEGVSTKKVIVTK
jgi:hypothetical protein